MNVLAPMYLGEADNKGKILTSISWFYWTDRGYEFTCGFTGKTNNCFSRDITLITATAECEAKYEVSDYLVESGDLKSKGYPFKGKGKLFGLSYVNGKLFAHLIIESKGFAHVYCECTNDGLYVPYGDILEPPTWLSDERKTGELLAKFANKVQIFSTT